jgi:hypothetical protein
MKLKTACRILGVSPDLGDVFQSVAKQRYHELLKQHHPDVNNGSSQSHNRTIELNQAFQRVKLAGPNPLNPRRMTITEFVALTVARERANRKTKLRSPTGQFYYV